MSLRPRGKIVIDQHLPALFGAVDHYLSPQPPRKYRREYGTHMNTSKRKLFDPDIVKRAILDSFLKLNPRHQIRNPVMFVVFIGSLLATLLIFVGEPGITRGFIIGVTIWLWFTVLFANFAEAMAEGRGKAQADTLRRARKDTPAKKLSEPHYGATHEIVSAASLRCRARRDRRLHPRGWCSH